MSLVGTRPILPDELEQYELHHRARIAIKTEFPFTMGQNQFDFIDYEDFCKQVAAAVGQDEINGIINICSGKPEKLADRVERFIKENGYGIKLKYGALIMRR